jgi:hypothetical protein
MPCRDDWGAADRINDATRPLRQQINMLEAMLCGLMTVLGNAAPLDRKLTLDRIDYKEGGFTRTELEDWFKKHRLHDEQRRQREREREANIRRDKEATLRKLAKELGMKVS